VSARERRISYDLLSMGCTTRLMLYRP